MIPAVARSRPLDLFKRHPDKFMLCGGGNVTLKKFHEKGEVRELLDQQGAAKASRRLQTGPYARGKMEGTGAEQCTYCRWHHFVAKERRGRLLRNVGLRHVERHSQ